MKLSTPVDIPASVYKIDHQTPILLIGSCFADAMGQRLLHDGFNATVNPTGILYNPLSIAQAIIGDGHFDIVEHDGLWHSMQHHGQFSRPTAEELTKAVLEANTLLYNALNKAERIIVTFGTAFVYEYHNRIAANCHKLPESEFKRFMVNENQIVAAWKPLLNRYKDKQWLFTISPIRHIRDGLHENNLSKATLLLATNTLIKSFDNVTYFPAYEIINDELRDYRFYADDLVHPSNLAEDYVYERFKDCFMTESVKNEARLRYKEWLRSQHRELHV